MRPVSVIPPPWGEPRVPGLMFRASGDGVHRRRAAANRRRPPIAWGRSMMLWPAVALIGFLVLTALVIAMGTSSTARYEQERQLADAPAGGPAAEAVGAA